jgi:HK97 gp10 family phage protein
MSSSGASEIAGKLAKLFELGGEGYRALSDALDKACIGVEGSAKRRAPVRTSNLRNSIRHDVRMEETTGYVGTSVPYAPYVEIGTGIYSSQGDGRKTPWIYTDPETGEKVFTRGSHPHPFLKPAVEENESAILKCFEGIL